MKGKEKKWNENEANEGKWKMNGASTLFRRVHTFAQG